jgi:hypothetical protein
MLLVACSTALQPLPHPIAMHSRDRSDARGQKWQAAIGTASLARQLWSARVPSWLVECLRLEVGHARTVRPDPSTLGAVGERGSRRESCLQLG